jgi:hypothetical protein
LGCADSKKYRIASALVVGRAHHEHSRSFLRTDVRFVDRW